MLHGLGVIQDDLVLSAVLLCCCVAWNFSLQTLCGSQLTSSTQLLILIENFFFSTAARHHSLHGS